ncbi:MAG: cytochrome c oxidase subunit 3, partial [Nitrospirales bacterium]|nr:cytochrome c oxidase subunit 3 [Nitrospirales bacterium]
MIPPPAPDTAHTAEEHRVGRHGAAFGMWLFLITELLFFGGLFLLYSVFRAHYPQEFHAAAREENTVLGAANTVILITSSLTIALALSALKEGKKRLSAFLQGVTLLCGSAFLVNKYFEWGAKIAHGVYPDSPVLLQRGKGEALFYGLYYVMTGLHGLHVLIGMCVIAAMLWFTIRERITAGDF